jgi:hypothetical protein
MRSPKRTKRELRVLSLTKVTLDATSIAELNLVLSAHQTTAMTLAFIKLQRQQHHLRLLTLEDSFFVQTGSKIAFMTARILKRAVYIRHLLKNMALKISTQ